MEKKDFKLIMKMCVAITTLFNGLLLVSLKVHPKYVFLFAVIIIVQSVIVYFKEDKKSK